MFYWYIFLKKTDEQKAVNVDINNELLEDSIGISMTKLDYADNYIYYLMAIKQIDRLDNFSPNKSIKNTADLKSTFQIIRIIKECLVLVSVIFKSNLSI